MQASIIDDALYSGHSPERYLCSDMVYMYFTISIEQHVDTGLDLELYTLNPPIYKDTPKELGQTSQQLQGQLGRNYSYVYTHTTQKIIVLVIVRRFVLAPLGCPCILGGSMYIALDLDLYLRAVQWK